MSRVFDLIAVAITMVWASSFVADVLDSGYTTPPLMHTLMTAIIGAYAGAKVLTKDKEG